MSISAMMVKGYNSAPHTRASSFQSRFSHTSGGNKPPTHVANKISRKSHKRGSTVRIPDFSHRHTGEVEIDGLNNALQNFGKDNIVKCNGRDNNTMINGSNNTLTYNGSGNHVVINGSELQLNVPGSNQHIEFDKCGKMHIHGSPSNEPASMLEKMIEVAKRFATPTLVAAVGEGFRFFSNI